MKSWMRTLYYMCMVATLACSCERGNDVFAIVGEWGVTAITMTTPGGETERFEKMPKKQYYQRLEFKPDGTLVRTYDLTHTVNYGDYVFNAFSGSLQYKYDGQTKYINAIVTVNSPRDITITADLGSVGRDIYHAVKIGK